MAIRILMVCLGNICRSPLAEGILRSKLGSEHILVDSAGTGGYHVGGRPDSRSIETALKYGIDISGQRCRKFSIHDFSNFDLIYAMDRQNYMDIISLARSEEEAGKVKLLMEGVQEGILEIPDPYYGGEDGFEKVYQLIDLACNHITGIIKNP